MTPELTVLALALLLQAGQFVLMSVGANQEVGASRTLSPRDGMDLEAELSTRTARLKRALDNHFEGLTLFVPAALMIAVSGQSSALTATCAWAYLGARILYVPAYALGWVPWRSLIWMVGFTATVVMILAALL